MHALCLTPSPLGADWHLWNANLASQGRGRGGRTFESRSRSVSNVLHFARVGHDLPACSDAIFSRCEDEDDLEKATNLYLFNEKMLHLVDDIFWHLGFKSTEHAQQVMSQIIDIVIIAMIMIILIIIGSRRNP